MSVAQLFYYGAKILTLCILGASVLIGFLKFSLLNKEQKFYLYFLVFIFFIELICNLLIELGMTNMFVYPFYISGEFFLLSALFIKALKQPDNRFIIAGILSILMLVEGIILLLNSQNVTLGYGKLISHIIIICLSGYYLIMNLKSTTIEKKNNFLLVYGCLFLYYIVSLFLFLLMNQLSATTILNASILWGINNLFTAILYFLSLYTFIKLK